MYDIPFCYVRHTIPESRTLEEDVTLSDGMFLSQVCHLYTLTRKWFVTIALLVVFIGGMLVQVDVQEDVKLNVR